MNVRFARDAPLCPVGHLPLKGGDSLLTVCCQIPIKTIGKNGGAPISPLEGEMRFLKQELAGQRGALRAKRTFIALTPGSASQPRSDGCGRGIFTTAIRPSRALRMVHLSVSAPKLLTQYERRLPVSFSLERLNLVPIRPFRTIIILKKGYHHEIFTYCRSRT